MIFIVLGFCLFLLIVIVVIYFWLYENEILKVIFMYGYVWILMGDRGFGFFFFDKFMINLEFLVDRFR